MKKVLYILGQLSDEDVEWMSQSGRCVEYRGGDTIIQAGQPISALFIAGSFSSHCYC